MAAPLKIIYAGSPQYAVPALEKLIESGKNVVAVITQPDKPVGRRQALTPTPVKLCAQKHGLPVFDFAKIRDHVAEIKELASGIFTPRFCPNSAARRPFNQAYSRAKRIRASP